jgi:hypothetical protein
MNMFFQNNPPFPSPKNMSPSCRDSILQAEEKEKRRIFINYKTTDYELIVNYVIVNGFVVQNRQSYQQFRRLFLININVSK